MKPLEALERAFMYVGTIRNGKHGKPGEVIQRMGEEAHEALSRLTSEELATLRFEKDWIDDDAQTKLSKSLLAFDKKFLRK